MKTDLRQFAVIFRKECRENLVYALIIVAATCLVGGFLLHETLYFERSDLDRLGTYFLRPVVPDVLTFASMGGAILLGIVQILHEGSRDRWAFFLHRPAKRTTLFLGKSTAGLALLLLSLVLPSAAYMIWAATRWTAAPFHWHFLLPTLVAILTGIPFYFCTLLIARRHARWYASRVVPIVVLFLIAYLAYKSWSFPLAVGLLFAASVLTAVAAWGSFIALGHDDSSPMFTQFASAVLVTLGVGVILCAPSIYIARDFIHLDALLRPTTFTDSRYMLTGDMQIITRQVHWNTTLRGAGTLQYFDLAGNPVPKPVERKNAQGAVLRDYSSTSFHMRPVYRADFHTIDSTYWYGEAGWREHGSHEPTAAITQWFYVVPSRYFVRFNLLEQRCDQWYGATGAASDSSHVVPFSEAAIGPKFTTYPSIFVDFELDKHREHTIFAVGPNERIAGTTYLASIDPVSGETRYSEPVVITNRRLLIRLSDMQQTGPDSWESTNSRWLELPVPPVDDATQITLARSADKSRYLVWSTPIQLDYSNDYFRFYPINGAADFRPGFAASYDADGKLLSTTDLPCLLDPQLLRPDASLETVGVVFAGPAAAWAYSQLIRVVNPYDYDPSNLVVLLKYRPLRWLAWIFTPSLLAAVSTFWLLTRRKAPIAHRIFWTFYVLIFGLPGFVGVLAVAARPVLVPCPRCKKRRAVDRDLCSHCGKPFAAPERNGTEIFEGSGAGVLAGSASSNGLQG